MKKKVVMKVEIPIALTESEYLALQAAVGSKRKLTPTQVVKHFTGIVDDYIDELCEKSE